MQRRTRTQRSRAPRALMPYAGAYDFEAASEPDLADAAAGPDAADGADAPDAPDRGPADAAVDEPDAGDAEPGGDDDAAAPAPPAWQTPDGYVLNLPPQILDRLILRRGAPAPWPVLRRIGQLARGARRIGALRHRPSGHRYPIFRARAGGRSYRILARPRPVPGRRTSRGARGGMRRLRHEILLVRGADAGLEREFELIRGLENGGGGWGHEYEAPPRSPFGDAGLRGKVTPEGRKFLARVRKGPQDYRSLLLTVLFHPKPGESKATVKIGAVAMPMLDTLLMHSQEPVHFLDELRRIAAAHRKASVDFRRQIAAELRLRKKLTEATGRLVRDELLRSGSKSVSQKLRPHLQAAANAQFSFQQYRVGLEFAHKVLGLARQIIQSGAADAHFTSLGLLLRRYAETFKKKGTVFELPVERETGRAPAGGGSAAGSGGASCSGWKSDPQSFSRVIAKHHIRTETGKSLEVRNTVQVSPTAWRVDFPGGIAVFLTLSRVPHLVAAARWQPKPAGPSRFYTYSCTAKGQVVFHERPKP